MKKDSKIEVENNLRQLVQNKELDVRVDRKGEEEYSLTDEGIKKAKELLVNEDNQLFLFTLTFNVESQNQGVKTTGDKFVALKKSLEFMVKEINPDFESIFLRAVAAGKIRGITLASLRSKGEKK